MRNYSAELERYRQSGDICEYLNVNIFTPTVYELPAKFAVFEAAGFHWSNNTIMELVFPTIIRQFIVARCSYEYYLSYMNVSNFLVKLSNTRTCFQNETVQEYGPNALIPLGQYVVTHYVPAFLAILGILFNVSLLIVTTRKMC
jgi:hypothetical protein